MRSRLQLQTAQNTAKKSVTVKVLDSDEDGKITIAHAEPADWDCDNGNADRLGRRHRPG